jgi:putative heme degradation protein
MVFVQVPTITVLRAQALVALIMVHIGLGVVSAQMGEAMQAARKTNLLRMVFVGLMHIIVPSGVQLITSLVQIILPGTALAFMVAQQFHALRQT